MDADTPRDPGSTQTAVRPSRRPEVPTVQLRLLEPQSHPEWCLDDTTREVGRRGVEAARAALRSAHRHRVDPPDSHHAPSAA